mgnify:CR=1 FL=1
MRKKFLITLVSIILIIGMCGSIYATNLETSLNVIQNASETKYLENDQGYITKTIIDSNPKEGEITVELKIANTAKDKLVKHDNTEIVLVIDNSQSMEEIVSGELTRRDVLLNSANSFANSVYDNINNVKIGIVTYYGHDEDENGEVIQKTGTIETSNIIQELTEDRYSVQKALESLHKKDYQLGTNTDAGLERAKQMLSNKDANRFIILLSDGVPNDAIGLNLSNFSYGGILGDYATKEEALKAIDQYVINTTQKTMKSIDNEGINLISILAGLGELEEDDLNILNSVFGTPEKPTIGKFYNIADTNINKIVSENIYSDVLEKIQNPIDKVKIIDYFSDDIIDNFEFLGPKNSISVLGSPVSIDLEKKVMSWDIGKIKGEQAAIYQYRLKLKNMQNTELLNKTIAISEKTVLTYQDVDQKEYEVELTNNPKIQLVEVEQPVDDTIANDILPKAGARATIIGFIIVTILSIVIYKKYNSYKDIK